MDVGKLTSRSIATIRPGETNWKCNVVVLGKTNPHTTRTGKLRLQKCLLQDEMGDQVEIMLWNEKIESHARRLSAFNTYSIRGALVRKIKEEYQHLSPGMIFEWSVVSRTTVVLIADPQQQIPYPPYNYTELAASGKALAEGSSVDILAVVVDVQKYRDVDTKYGPARLQELQLMDRSMLPTTFTLWTEFIEIQGAEIYNARHRLPVIMCRRAAASDYTDGALQANSSSYVIVDPDIPEAINLRTWVSENIGSVRAAQAKGRPPKIYIESEIAAARDQATLEGMQTELKRFTIVGKMSIVDFEQSIAYGVCKECKKALTAEKGEEIDCDQCDGNREILPKYRVAVAIKDETQNIAATLFDSRAEQLLKCEPGNIHAMKAHEVRKLLLEANAALGTMRIVAEIRTSAKSYPHQKTRYTVHKWYEATGPNTLTPGTSSAASTTTQNEESQHAAEHKRTNDDSLKSKATVSPSTKRPQTEGDQPNKPGFAEPSQPTTALEVRLAVETPERNENKKLKMSANQPNPNILEHQEETQDKTCDPRKLRQVKIEKGAQK